MGAEIRALGSKSSRAAVPMGASSSTLPSCQYDGSLLAPSEPEWVNGAIQRLGGTLQWPHKYSDPTPLGC